MRRILFLDFDGVLNNTRWAMSQARKDMRALKEGQTLARHEMTHEIDPRNVRRLNEILRAVPGLRIVVSSSWRVGMTVEELQTFLAAVGVEPGRVIDKTGHHPSRRREDEIMYWLTEFGNRELLAPHSIRYAALDDDTFDMKALGENFVHVDRAYGLTKSHVAAVKSHFCVP